MERLLNKKPNKQKALLMLLDGWSLSPQNLNCFFHKNSDPFFRSLLTNFRSLPIAKKPEHHPQKTFFAGSDIFHQRRLAQDVQTPKNFWQNSKLIQASDSLKRSGGRLWFLNYDPSEHFFNLIQEARNNGISKVGVYLSHLPENSLNWQRTVPDLVTTTMVDHHQFKIQPEDVLVYFCDLADINQYHYIINRQPHSPLRSYVLTDESESGLIDAIFENKSGQNLQNILTDRGFSVSHHSIDPSKNILLNRQSDIAFVHLPDDFFDFDLPTRFLNRRRQHLITTLQNLLHETAYHIILTSRFGNPKKQSDNFELLPFIIIDSPLEHSNIINSPIEQYFKTRHSLADVAPTILELLGIKQPVEMTGRSMLKNLYPEHYIGDHTLISMRHPTPTPKSMFE